MADNRDRPQISMLAADRVRRVVALFLLGVFVATVVARGTHLWRRYENTIADTQHQAQGLAHVLGEHLERTIAATDSALGQIALSSERIGGSNGIDLYWDPILDAAFAGLEGVRSLIVLNENGLVAHSTVKEIIGQSRADQFLFWHLRATDSRDLIADTPYRNPVNGRVSIPLGRRLVTADGSFDGVVVATLEPERLRKFYRSIDLGADGLITVLHPTGTVLFREPSPTDPIGELDAGNPLFRALGENSRDGFLRGPLTPGGDSYISAVRRLSQPPLLLAVSLDESDALQAWWTELLISALIIGAVTLLMVMANFLFMREIRARLAADAALEENRARFHEIMYHAPILVSVKDVEGRVQFVNRELEKSLGISFDDLRDKKLLEALQTEPVRVIAALDREVVETKRPIQRELSYRGKEGVRTALFVKFPLLDKDGNVEAVASFSTDITEQRRMQTRFRTIVDHAPAVIVLKDLQGRFIFVNREFERILNRPASEILGRTTRDLLSPEYGDLHDAFDREVIEAKAPIQREVVAPFPAGPRTLLFVKFPIFDARGNVDAIGAISTDITEQKQVEAQLAKAQRMEAVGQLSGGLAHDFNNLLTVIIGNAELLAAELKNDERLHPLAEVTLDAAERSASLTQRLLAFARRQMLEPKPTDVRALVEDMEDLIARAAGEQVTIDYRYADDLWPTIVDPAQLETAILNLVVNARDAMTNGGRITIEMSNVEIEEGDVQLNPDAKAGDYVMLTVSDTGTGMPPEVVARVFEPFFTTKEVGKGTGLGLPMIYGFAKQSGGHIKIYSEVGHGTVVRLYIPRAGSPSLAPSLPDAKPESLPHGSETILLVEDDKLVRAHTEAQLAELGYRVTAVASADEALRLSRLTGRPDLLLTDVMMPGKMNGRELALRMRERWPELKVLYTSGYTDGALAEFAEGGEELHFLSKPFRRRDLAVKVREALNSAPTFAASAAG
ncbi:MAG: PAS domain-containing protein [Bradyrhizobiaceae bacterium]|nr:PAS domain-containing protein [Bradyrhizobiaceae bacterium]